jgi:hypothetical protein
MKTKIDSSGNTTRVGYVVLFFRLFYISDLKTFLADDLNKFILHHFQTTEPLTKAKL